MFPDKVSHIKLHRQYLVIPNKLPCEHTYRSLGILSIYGTAYQHLVSLYQIYLHNQTANTSIWVRYTTDTWLVKRWHNLLIKAQL